MPSAFLADTNIIFYFYGVLEKRSFLVHADIAEIKEIVFLRISAISARNYFYGVLEKRSFFVTQISQK